MLEFKITPPNLTPWLNDKKRSRSIVLLDMQVDQEEIKKLRFDFDIAFNSISVRRGKIDRKDYYIGCTGAEIFFKVNNGKVIDYTKGSTLNVEYKIEKEFVRNTSLNLTPEFKIKEGKVDKSLKLGSLKYEKSKKTVFSANFNSGERTLEPIHLSDAVKWQINLPRGLKVVRDYLLGNLYLYVICNSANGNFSGKIKLKPSDILFFGSDRSPLNKRKSIYMRYIMYKNGIEIDNPDGIETQFNQEK